MLINWASFLAYHDSICNAKTVQYVPSIAVVREMKPNQNKVRPTAKAMKTMNEVEVEVGVGVGVDQDNIGLPGIEKKIFANLK